MQRTLKISGNSKYARIEVKSSTLYASVSRGPRMDGTVGFAWSGTYTPAAADRPAIEAALEAVMADGVARTLTVGQAAPVEKAVPEWRSERGLSLTEEMDAADSNY